MIRITRPSPPSRFAAKAEAATRGLQEQHDADPEALRRGSKRFVFDEKLYRSVKSVLLKAQRGKCAFCESKVKPIDADVEHFRPKAAFTQKRDEPLQRPGYYWLAYRWENLLVACKTCNQTHKRNWFPLANPKVRARSRHESLDREKPLLIDPSSDDPTRFLSFRGPEAYPIEDCVEGRATIEIVGLNSNAHKEARLNHLDDFMMALEVLELVRQRVRREPEPSWLKRLDNVEEHLRNRTADESEYSAMCRAYLAHFEGRT